MLAGDRQPADRNEEKSTASENQQVSVKVIILAGPLASKVNASSKKISNSLALASSTVDKDDDKPSRALIPIDYAEDELKQHVHYLPSSSYTEDGEDLHDKLGKTENVKDEPVLVTPFDIVSVAASDASAAMKHAQILAHAQMKAKEIAAKISNNMITSTSSSSAANRVDSEKHRQKQLVDKIPTDKDALFAYEVDWILADRLGIVLKEMKPWIHKKVLEYLGEEEKTLISFIETKLMKHCSPSDLLNELAPVLDEDAEQFVVKLWRMLIFSILKHSSC